MLHHVTDGIGLVDVVRIGRIDGRPKKCGLLVGEVIREVQEIRPGAAIQFTGEILVVRVLVRGLPDVGPLAEKIRSDGVVRFRREEVHDCGLVVDERLHGRPRRHLVAARDVGVVGEARRDIGRGPVGGGHVVAVDPQDGHDLVRIGLDPGDDLAEVALESAAVLQSTGRVTELDHAAGLVGTIVPLTLQQADAVVQLRCDAVVLVVADGATDRV